MAMALRISSDADKIARQLQHAIDMQKRAATRAKRAATALHKWTAIRSRIERKIGQSEVDRIVNSEAARKEITSRKNRVRSVVDRVASSTENK